MVPCCRLTDGFVEWAAFVPSPANGPVGKYQFTPNQTYALYPQLAKAKSILLPVNQVGAQACMRSWKRSLPLL